MWLGLDLGTSSSKAVLVDDSGRVVAEATAPLAASRPGPGWSEQNPEDWWQAARDALLALPADLRAVARGMGLSRQMHGATLLDATDRVIRPAILWNDGRAAAECRDLEAAEPRAGAITGNRAMPGFTAPKLRWVGRHEPEAFARVATVLLPKDYLRLRLTGGRASDPSDAVGTLWIDVEKRRWSCAQHSARVNGDGKRSTRNVWPAPSARGFVKDGMMVCINVSGLKAEALAKMDIRAVWSYKSAGAEHHI